MSGFHFLAPVLSDVVEADVATAEAARSGLFMRRVLKRSPRRAATRVPLWSVLMRMFEKPPSTINRAFAKSSGQRFDLWKKMPWAQVRERAVAVIRVKNGLLGRGWHPLCERASAPPPTHTHAARARVFIPVHVR